MDAFMKYQLVAEELLIWLPMESIFGSGLWAV